MTMTMTDDFQLLVGSNLCLADPAAARLRRRVNCVRAKAGSSIAFLKRMDDRQGSALLWIILCSWCRNIFSLN
jgi:hypothetical protein